MQLEIVSVWDYRSLHDSVRIEPSGLKRTWMDETQDEYAYRCLPLNIANQHGWAIYPQKQIAAVWNGKQSIEKENISIIENHNNLAVSWFGHGILTFSLPFLVKVAEGYSLYISGAPNHFKKGIQPCTGIYEADWAPYSFTMNWKFTHGYETVVFTPDDPICFFFPVKRNDVEMTKTKFTHIDEQDAKFKEMNDLFNTTRQHWNDENLDGWQKHYFKGEFPDGSKCPVDHKTKLKLSKLIKN